MSKLSIYFCGSIRGGRADASIYREIIQHLKTFGTVMTEHVGSDEFNEEGVIIGRIFFSYYKGNRTHDVKSFFSDDAKLTEKQIHDRDVSWLKRCDGNFCDSCTSSCFWTIINQIYLIMCILQ